MKRFKFQHLLALLLPLTAAVVYTGCSHDTDVFDGPALNDIYGEFFIVEPLAISDRDVDFTTEDDPYFTCTFSKNVNWTLHITGLTSGATKQISDLSNQLNVSNATWNGSTTIFPMFTAEECAVMVTVENETDTLRDTLTVATPKVDEGLLVTDFENGASPIWGGFVQSGANMSFNITNQQPRAQGSFVYDMGGEVNWDWLIGMIEFPAQASGGLTFDLPENPDNVWFNVLLYRPENVDNALVLFQFREDENEDGSQNEAEEDMWAFEIRPEEVGWQLVSMRYSDIVALNNGMPVAANGNNLHEPNKLGRVSVLMLADPSSGYSQCLMDYVIFTEGGPLQP